MSRRGSAQSGEHSVADVQRLRATAGERNLAVRRRAPTPTTPTTAARAQLRMRAVNRLTAARSHNPHAYTSRLTLPGVSRAAEKTLRADMTQLRGMRGVHNLVIDNKTGERVRSPRGTGPVSTGRTGGRIFVRAGGPVATWSGGDYRQMTQRSGPGIKTAIIVGQEGMAVLQPRKDGTWPDFETEVKPALRAVFHAHAEALAAQRVRRGNSKTQQAALDRVGSKDILQQAWKDAARATGMRYAQVSHSGRAVYSMNLDPWIVPEIASGRKTVEGRMGSNIFKTMRKGDVISFNHGELHVEVGKVNRYTNALELAQGEGHRRLGFSRRYAPTAQDVAAVYNKIYPLKWQRPGIGFLGIHVKPTHAERQYEPLPGIGRTRGRTTPARGKRPKKG